jgi:hypothetical protein
VAFGDGALQERAKLAISHKIAGNEERRLDLALLERVQDRLGALSEITAREDQREFLDVHIAADYGAVFVPDEVIGRLREGARSANERN